MASPRQVVGGRPRPQTGRRAAGGATRRPAPARVVCAASPRIPAALTAHRSMFILPLLPHIVPVILVPIMRLPALCLLKPSIWGPCFSISYSKNSKSFKRLINIIFWGRNHPPDWHAKPLWRLARQSAVGAGSPRARAASRACAGPATHALPRRLASLSLAVALACLACPWGAHCGRLPRVSRSFENACRRGSVRVLLSLVSARCSRAH